MRRAAVARGPARDRRPPRPRARGHGGRARRRGRRGERAGDGQGGARPRRARPRRRRRGARPSGAGIVRPPEEDLFRTSPLVAISERRTIRSFGPGDVPARVRRGGGSGGVHRARAPPHAPVVCSRRSGPPPRSAGCSRRSPMRGADLLRRRRPRRKRSSGACRWSDALLGAAPVLIVPWSELRAAPILPRRRAAAPEREMFLLSGGAAIQNLLLALHAQGVGSCWVAVDAVLPGGDARRARPGRGVVRDGDRGAGPLPGGPAAPPPPRSTSRTT